MPSRRDVLRGLVAASMAAALDVERTDAAEALPETRTVRFTTYPGACIAPQWVAEDLLRAEGFTSIQYVEVPEDLPSGRLLETGKADFSVEAAPAIPVHVAAGVPMVALAGLHAGCFELFGSTGIRTIRELRGKLVSVPAQGDERHVFVSVMLAQVGLDPRKDVRWDFRPSAQGMQLFVEGKVDAFLGFPPDPQELRARKVGHVIVDTLVDRPWSQYFCCVLTGSRPFVRSHPVATKRILRAIIKATQACAQEPERVTQFLAAKGYERRQEYALQLLKRLPYGRWREFGAEDTLRFYARRLNEAGLIRANPQKILADGTDWRFLDELKKELKG